VIVHRTVDILIAVLGLVLADAGAAWPLPPRPLINYE